MSDLFQLYGTEMNKTTLGTLLFKKQFFSFPFRDSNLDMLYDTDMNHTRVGNTHFLLVSSLLFKKLFLPSAIRDL